MMHKSTLDHFFMDIHGKYYLTGSADKDDTTIKVWNLAGDMLSSINTN